MSRELYFSSVHDKNKVNNNKTACSLEDVTGIDLKECVFIQTGKRGNNTMRGVGTVRVPHTMVCQCPIAFGKHSEKVEFFKPGNKICVQFDKRYIYELEYATKPESFPSHFLIHFYDSDCIYILMSSHITLFERSLRFRKGYSDLYNHERFERQFKRKV